MPIYYPKLKNKIVLLTEQEIEGLLLNKEKKCWEPKYKVDTITEKSKYLEQMLAVCLIYLNKFIREKKIGKLYKKLQIKKVANGSSTFWKKYLILM